MALRWAKHRYGYDDISERVLPKSKLETGLTRFSVSIYVTRSSFRSARPPSRPVLLR
ncbi:hypothetical protein RHECNPAF_7500117 [Rhizobium etli CNPAF512]|nr:hypothetical protein RHECNPAF_7500117 [Rhizobium etli CNPAF512]